MKYTVELPKVLCLILLISKFAKNSKYYNTNDLISLYNKIKPELVRLRKDKSDYIYLDDTNFGGLRGNISTALTLRGFIKKNNTYTTYYGIGKTDKLFNAFQKGQFILDQSEYRAYTNDSMLKKELEKEANNLSIRENQAHVKHFLQKNPNFPLIRDSINFPKVAVLKTKTNKYYLRILFNTLISENVIEYNLFNYLSGAKVKQFNMHALFAIPSGDNAWSEIYVIDSKEILRNSPLFIYYDKKAKKFYDKNKKEYPFMTLEESIEKISDQSGNIEERLKYNWKTLRKELTENQINKKDNIQEDEFSVFLNKFLKWKNTFKIYDKTVVQIKVSSSGGADVILKYSGGTTQKLELEHKWNNYITHKHYKSQAWTNTWLYADEKWNFETIKKIFKPYLSEYKDNIPKVFLCTDKQGEKAGYEVNWDNDSFTKLTIED